MAVFRRRLPPQRRGNCPLRGVVLDYESLVLPVPVTMATLAVDEVHHIWIASVYVDTLDQRTLVWGTYNPMTCALSLGGQTTVAGSADYIRVVPDLGLWLRFFNAFGDALHRYGTYNTVTGAVTAVGTVAATYGAYAHGGIVDPTHHLWWGGTDSGGGAALQYGHLTGAGVPVSDGSYSSGLAAQQFVPGGIDIANNRIHVYRSDTGGTQLAQYDPVTGAITSLGTHLTVGLVHNYGADGWAWVTEALNTYLTGGASYPVQLADNVLTYQGAIAEPYPVLAADHQSQIAFGIDVANNQLHAGFYCK